MPPRKPNEMVVRLENLEERMIRVESKVDELHDDLHGNGQSPGLFEMMRSTQSIARDTQTIVETLKMERWVLRGIVIGTSVLIGLIGWLLNFSVRP